MVTAFNACIEPLGEMEVVEAEEAAKMKAFLGGASFGLGGIESMHSTGEGPSAMSANREERASMHAEEVNDEIGDKDLGDEEKAQVEEIDWARVGKIYDRGTDINDVIKREIGRIN